MKGKKLLLALAVATLMALPLVSAFAAEPGDPDTTVTVTDASMNIETEATSEITVSIVNGETDPVELRGVEVHLTFDPPSSKSSVSRLVPLFSTARSRSARTSLTTWRAPLTLPWPRAAARRCSMPPMPP